MSAYGTGLGARQPGIDSGARIERPQPTRTPAMAVRMRFERFDLDEDNALLLCGGKPVAMPPRQFEVLCALLRRPGSLVTKNALLDEVWGHRFVSESVLKTAIGKLRIALQDDARNPRFIETVPRRGYRFIAESVAAGDPPASPATEPRLPQPPARLDGAGGGTERVLREIREMLRLLIEQPHRTASEGR